MKNWVGAVVGEKPRVLESHKPLNALQRILGEAEARPAPDEVEAAAPPPIPPEQVDDPGDPGEAEDTLMRSNSGVDALVSAWESGSHMSVAEMVLAGLPRYADLVSLLFQIGHEGATELASLMDELSASTAGEEESPGADLPMDDEIPVEEPPVER